MSIEKATLYGLKAMHSFIPKKPGFVLLLFFAYTFLVQGQNQFSIGLGASDIGFKEGGEAVYIGYEIASLEHKVPAFSYSISAGRIFRAEKRIQPVVALQYAREGLNYSRSFLFDNIKYLVKIDYMKVPVLLQLMLGKNVDRGFGLDLGPFVSYRIRAVRDITLNGEKELRKLENVRPMDVGIIVGVKYCALRNSFPLDFGFQISYSLVDMMTPLEGDLLLYYGPEEEYARNITLMFKVSTLLSGKS